MNFLSVLTSLGPTVVLPIIITLVGLIFRRVSERPSAPVSL